MKSKKQIESFLEFLSQNPDILTAEQNALKWVLDRENEMRDVPRR